jgi:hypothetical protein
MNSIQFCQFFASDTAPDLIHLVIGAVVASDVNEKWVNNSMYLVLYLISQSFVRYLDH